MVKPRSPHDVFTPEDRSRVMRAVKGKDTKPEMIVRRMAHALGYRYRLHRKDLPGKPDLVFVGRKKVIFVHGCFWHGHDCARGSRQPKTNAEYWRAKIARNISRDAANLQALDAQGWQALVLWECDLKDRDALAVRLRDFLR
ncbi:very short patch repair endonuclease [Oceanicaulis alexandrii]|uniref:very short patch repair endonuclease n=1 Tax=Oceanicaulis alexandrii TaxID=153233 RepID=UPI0023573801|nr:very short patch repair endonuclease [Oceanicaulis alexandrii]